MDDPKFGQKMSFVPLSKNEVFWPTSNSSEITKKKKKKNFVHVEWAFSRSLTLTLSLHFSHGLALSLPFLSQITLLSPFFS